jgi:hypothetical protein
MPSVPRGLGVPALPTISEPPVFADLVAVRAVRSARWFLQMRAYARFERLTSAGVSLDARQEDSRRLAFFTREHEAAVKVERALCRQLGEVDHFGRRGAEDSTPPWEYRLRDTKA